MNEEILKQPIETLGLHHVAERQLRNRGVKLCGDLYKVGVLRLIDLSLYHKPYFDTLVEIMDEKGLETEKFKTGEGLYSPELCALLRVPINEIFIYTDTSLPFRNVWRDIQNRSLLEVLKYCVPGDLQYRHRDDNLTAALIKIGVKDLQNRHYEIQDDNLPMDLIQQQLEFEKNQTPEETELRKITLEDLNLNERAYNALSHSGVRNLWQLLRLTERDISRLRNVGPETITHINDKLAQIGHSIGENAVIKDPNLVPIEKVGASSQVCSALRSNGIQTIGQLLSLKRNDLLNIKNIGEATVLRLQKTLRETGYAFLESTPKEIVGEGSKKSTVVEDKKFMEEEKVETEEKDELLEKLLTSEEGLGVLVDIPCQSFVKDSQEYEKISTAVEAYLNETLKAELKTAKSEADFEKISVLLENMRNSFKDIVNTKRQEIFALEETKAKFAASQQAKNGDVKKYHHKTQTDPDQRHSHNPFAEDLGREL